MPLCPRFSHMEIDREICVLEGLRSKIGEYVASSYNRAMRKPKGSFELRSSPLLPLPQKTYQAMNFCGGRIKFAFMLPLLLGCTGVYSIVPSIKVGFSFIEFQK